MRKPRKSASSKLSVSYLLPVCPSKSFQTQEFQNQNSNALPLAKKLIQKKNSRKNFENKPVVKEVKHTVYSSSTNSHVFGIDETTRQRLITSEVSKQDMDVQNEEPNSVGFNFRVNQSNSNLQTQKPQEFKDYFDSISATLAQRELIYVPKPIVDMLSISQVNRNKLVTWMFDQSSRFHFKEETPFLATNIVDRVLGMVTVSIDRLPILGVTALFMATKYEEMLIPHIHNFVVTLPASYKVTKESVLKLQGILLDLISFDLGYVSPLLFIHQTCIRNPLAEPVKIRALALAKQLLINSRQIYQVSSKIARLAIRQSEQECLFNYIQPTSNTKISSLTTDSL